MIVRNISRPQNPSEFPWRVVEEWRGLTAKLVDATILYPGWKIFWLGTERTRLSAPWILGGAFHERPLPPDSRPVKFSFTRKGVYQRGVNVTGLMNASQQFQQMMADRLAGVIDAATPYEDGILVEINEKEGKALLAGHAKDLRGPMDIISEVKMVGGKVFRELAGILWSTPGPWDARACPRGLVAIEKWEIPRTITALRAFIGLTSF